MKPILTSLLLASLFFISGSVRVLAVTATASATASDSATKTMIKEQVEKAIREQADPQVKGMVDALKQQKFGIIGTLEKIVGSSLQVRSVKGTLRLIELDKGAVILNLQQRQIAKEDLELNVPVIVMGYRQDDNALLARRIIISDESIFGLKRTSIFGKATQITAKQITLSTQPVKLTSTTMFLNSLGSSVKRAMIKVGDPIIAIFTDTQTGTASARRIFTLSPAAIPSPSVIPLAN